MVLFWHSDYVEEERSVGDDALSNERENQRREADIDMAKQVTWPLAKNLIRGGSERNTFGIVRKFANGSPKPHQGWDFSAPIGTPVYAIADGKVEFIKNIGDYGLQLCLSFHFDGGAYFAF